MGGSYMNYKVDGQNIILVLEQGEDIVEQVTAIAR